MDKLVLSSWAFNQFIETPITNEVPHLSVYNLLNRNLKSEWSRELIGMVKNYYQDFSSIKRMHPYLFNENYEGAEYLKNSYDHLLYKSAADANVPGFKVPEYLPKIVKYTDTASDWYNNLGEEELKRFEMSRHLWWNFIDWEPPTDDKTEVGRKEIEDWEKVAREWFGYDGVGEKIKITYVQDDQGRDTDEIENGYLPAIIPYIYTLKDVKQMQVHIVGQNKINMDISGSYETEMDYLMHEVSRYLSKLYPDHPNSVITLTESERQSYFNEAGCMIHSYFDTAQIQSGNELLDFYLRNKFLTNITTARAYTGVAKQEKLLVNLLQQSTSDIQMFTGFTSFITPLGEIATTSNQEKISDLATSYNLYKFSYNDDYSVEKTTAQKINGKISETLANFETGFSIVEPLESFQKNTKGFIVLNDKEYNEKGEEININTPSGRRIFEKLLKEINAKIEQFTTIGELPADTTIEQIYNVLGENGIETLVTEYPPVYPIFSTSYDVAGEAVVFSKDKESLLDVSTLKYLEGKWISRPASFSDLSKTPLVELGNIRYNEQFLLAAGNVIATHTISEYKISEEFQSIAKLATKNNGNVFLETTLSQANVPITFDASKDISYVEVENFTEEKPNSIVALKGFDPVILYKNCKIKFLNDKNSFTYTIQDEDILIEDEVVGYAKTEEGKLNFYFGKDKEGNYIEDISKIPFTTIEYFVENPLIPFPLSENFTKDLANAISTGGTFNYPAVGIKENFIALKNYFNVEFDKNLIKVLLHPNFLTNLESYVMENLSTIDFKNWKKFLGLDVISCAIAKPDLVTEMSFNISEDTIVDYKIIYTETPFGTDWATTADERYQIAKDYDPTTLKLVDFNDRGDVGGGNVSFAAAIWTGSNILSHPDAYITETLQSQNILELPIISFDYLGDLLSKYIQYNIVEYNIKSTNEAKLKTELSISDKFSLAGEPISLDSLGKLFFEETLSDQDLFEIYRKDCEFISEDIVRIKEYIRKDILQIGHPQIMIRDNYGHNYFSFINDCWEKDGYTYFKLKDSFDINELPNKKGLILINNEKKYSIDEEEVDRQSKRNVVSKKFYKNGQLIVFDFEWDVLSQDSLNYILNSIKSKPEEVYYEGSDLSNLTKVPTSLTEFEDVNILNTSSEKYPLIEGLIQENKSLYLDSSVKKFKHIPLSYGNLVSNEEYGSLSYTFTDGIPASIDYFKFDKDGYDKLKDMEDFLADPSKKPYDMEEIGKFYQRRHIIWGGVIWDANDTNKTIKNLRTIWSGYFTNFEIYSSEDVLPEEFIARILAHAQEYSHNIINYNYANNEGKPTGNYNLALLPTINGESFTSVEILQNDLFKKDLSDEKDIERNVAKDLIVESVKININVPTDDDILDKKTYALLVRKIFVEGENFKLKIVYDNDWFEPVWSDDFVIEKSGYSFSSIFNAIFLQETLGTSKLFDPITKDEEIGLLLEWALYKAVLNKETEEESFIIESNESEYENLYVQFKIDIEVSVDEEKKKDIQEWISYFNNFEIYYMYKKRCDISLNSIWENLYALKTGGYGGSRKIVCIPVLQNNGQLFVHCFNFELDEEGNHVIRKGVFYAYINALMCDSLLNNYKTVPVLNPADFSKLGNLVQKFQKYIPTSNFSCNFNNVDLMIEKPSGDEILNYVDEDTKNIINENVNVDSIPIKDTVENLGKLDFSIKNRDYSLVFKNRYFKEVFNGTVQFNTDESTEQNLDNFDILKCDMSFGGDLTFEKEGGHVLIYDIKAPTKRSSYTTDREIKVVDRDYSLQNLKILAIGNDRKTLYLKDNPLDGYNSVSQACTDLVPLDTTKHSQMIPENDLSLGKCWGETTDEIGYTFYKKKFITDGTINPSEGNMIYFPEELVSEDNPNPINLQEHMSVGDTIEIILHYPPTYRANPNLKYKMTFNADPECSGPYNLVGEINEGNYNKILIAGSNCLIAIRMAIGNVAEGENAVTNIGTYLNKDCSNYSIIEDVMGRKLLFAKMGIDQVGFKLHGTEVGLDNIFEDIESIQPYTKSAGQIIASPLLTESIKNTLVEEHTEYNTLGNSNIVGSIPIGLVGNIAIDDEDRVVFEKNGEYTFSRNPAEMEIIDATGHVGTAMVEDVSNVVFVNYENGDNNKLQNYVVEMVQSIFGDVNNGGLYDVSEAYNVVENLKNQNVINEPPTKELLACILFDNAANPININKDNIYVPNFEYIDIPYLQDRVELKIKWVKTPVIVGRSSYKVSDLGVPNLRVFAKLLENSWFRIRKNNTIQSWSISPDNSNYVIWDQENAVISVYDNNGFEKFQTAINSIGYHVLTNDLGDDKLNTIDISKNIFIKNDNLKTVLGKSSINNEENSTIYSYFEEGGDCYYPLLNPTLFGGENWPEENINEYNEYWKYCKKVDNLAPEVCRFPSFRWGIENQGLLGYTYSYDAIHKFLEETNIPTAQVVIDKIDAMLRGTGDESYFGKGVPFYPFKYNDTLDETVSALNVRQPSRFVNMLKTSKVLVTNETIQIYGEIEYPDLYQLRNELTSQYEAMYKAIYELDNPDKYNAGIARWESEGVDSIIEDAVNEIIENIRTSYSNFFSGNLNEEEGLGTTRKNFMLRISLQEEDMGVIYPQPLDESLSIKALTSPDGNSLMAITDTGKYSLGMATGDTLNALQESEGKVKIQDAEIFDAIKNAKCVSQDFEILSTGTEDVIAVTSSWDIITLTDNYTSKISEVGGDYIKLYEKILPAQVEIEQEVTILVSNIVKDNHKGFYYTNDILPNIDSENEESDNTSWNLLNVISPDRTLMEVVSKKYAEFATYENANSRIVSTELGYIKPSVFGDQIYTQIDGTVLKYHMYPLYDDISPDLRKNFYEEKDGELQYLKNMYGRYIYRITAISDTDGGQPYFELRKENDHICIKNEVEVYLKNVYDISEPEEVDESEIPEDVKEIYSDGNGGYKEIESLIPINGADEIAIKQNTLDSRTYYGIKYVDGKVWGLKKDGTTNEVSLQKIPAIKSNASFITKYQPYTVSKQIIGGDLEIKDNYLILHVNKEIVLPDDVFANTDTNKMLTKNLVYKDIYDIQLFIENYLNIIKSTESFNAESVVDEQLDKLQNISIKSVLEDELFEFYKVQGVIGALEDWVEELNKVSTVEKIYIEYTNALKDSLEPYKDFIEKDGINTDGSDKYVILLSSVIKHCIEQLKEWLANNTIVEDFYYINSLTLRIVNTTENLPVVRPITYFGIGEEGDTQTLLTKYNSEIIIPKWGYGQRLIGEYTTPSNCVFADGIFFNENKEPLKNQSGNNITLVEYDENTFTYKVIENIVPNLVYKSFRAADLNLDIDLPLKATESNLQLDPVLIDLSVLEKSNNTFSIRHKKDLPDFGKEINTYDLFISGMKISCKMLYSEAGMDPTKEVINLSDPQFSKFEDLESNIGYTRVHNTSNPIPNGILYRDVNNDFVYTNSIYSADTDKYFAFENGDLGRINRYGQVDRYGVTDYIHAISDTDILNKYLQLDNIFTNFKFIENQLVSVFNIDNFLNISHKYMNFSIDRSKFTIEEHEDYKTFLLKERLEDLNSIYLYEYIEKEEGTFNPDVDGAGTITTDNLKEAKFYPLIKKDNSGRLLLNIKYSAIFKSYNMVYLKDNKGNLVAKVYFRNPIDKDTLMVFSKIN